MLEAKPPAGEQETAYLPAGPPDPLIFEEFEGMNTTTTRPGVDDKQAYWLDGFMPLGPKRNLRTMWGLSAPLWTVPHSTIVSFYFINIQTVAYTLVFLEDGSIWAVKISTGAGSQIAAAGTVAPVSNIYIGVTQYGDQFALIVLAQTNGYYIWDGTTLYGPGANVPGYGTVPTGISGTAIEIYSGRVWIALGAAVQYSAPGSLTDFSTGSGGGDFVSVDSFLRIQFTQLKQTNGFLYLVADSSINYISGVQTSGSPPVTTFTNQNADPEIGTPYPCTVDVFSRNIIFANAFGAHVSYGGAVAKISEPLDGVYNTEPNFNQFIPSASKAIVFGKKIWILLLPFVDPVDGDIAAKLLMWNGKMWWASRQDVTLAFIQSQEINSVLTAWGTDQLSIYQLFQQPSVAFKKTAVTKLWDKPGGYQFFKFVSRLWAIVQYYSTASPTINVTIDNETGSSAQVPLPLTPSTTGYCVSAPQAVGQTGVLTGMTISTNCADVALVTAQIQDQIGDYRG